MIAPNKQQTEKIVEWNFNKRQNMALTMLRQKDTYELLYGGAKGGGKTVLGCRWSYLNCLELIERHNLKPSAYPVQVGFIGRKVAEHLKITTLKTWKEEIPSCDYQINEQKKEIVIRGTVSILYGGFDRSETTEKFNSGEFVFYFLDQAEELSEHEVGMIRGTRRKKINGKEEQYIGLLTANPAQCWLRRAFITEREKIGGKKLKFLQALPGDNNFLPVTYFDNLEMAFKHRPELLEAYKYGSWDALEGSQVIIRDLWLNNAKTLKFHEPQKRRLIVCDPARFGDDETVIYYMENTKIIEEDIYGKKGLDVTANKCASMANRNKDERGNAPMIVIDGDGLGGGVIDILRSMGFIVFEIHSAAKAMYPELYVNVRSEMWWMAGEKYSKGEIEEGDYRDPELDRQLNTVQYSIVKGRIQVEDKKEIKKRLAGGRKNAQGNSPDRADARIMGLYALQFIMPEELKRTNDRWEKRSRRHLDPMAV